MTTTFGTAILSAGQGKRLKLNCPKPLAPALSMTLVDYVIRSVEKFYLNTGVKGDIVAVTGYKREMVEDYLKAHYNAEELFYAVQEEQLGTADALRAYFNGHPEARNFDYTLVVCADTPMIRGADFEKLFKVIDEYSYDAVAATFETACPTGYGRIVRAEKGFHIVEEKDAGVLEKNIKEVNSGLYIMKTKFVLEHLVDVDCDNNAGEFYLTDLFQDNFNVSAVRFPDEETFIGVNTLEQLERVTTLLRAEKCRQLREFGVRFIDSTTNVIDWDVEVGEGTVIYPNVILEGDTKIGSDCMIGAGAVIADSVVEDHVDVLPYSVFDHGLVREKAQVGPFSRLRPGADVGEHAKVGNFVEIKKAQLHEGVKVSHLSYVGDAEIGENTNIGCGFITCNFDGANKFKTTIGKECFIGSDSQMVAPVTVGDKSFVASGSTITRDIPAGGFALSRGRQITKENMASRFIKTKKTV